MTIYTDCFGQMWSEDGSRVALPGYSGWLIGRMHMHHGAVLIRSGVDEADAAVWVAQGVLPGER